MKIKFHIVVLSALLLFGLTSATTELFFATTWAGTADNQLITSSALADAATTNVIRQVVGATLPSDGTKILNGATIAAYAANIVKANFLQNPTRCPKKSDVTILSNVNRIAGYWDDGELDHFTPPEFLAAQSPTPIYIYFTGSITVGTTVTSNNPNYLNTYSLLNLDYIESYEGSAGCTAVILTLQRTGTSNQYTVQSFYRQSWGTCQIRYSN